LPKDALKSEKSALEVSHLPIHARVELI